MDIKPLFSITIPAFKDKYLKEAIDSVMAQTYQNYEVVIVNDASPYNIDSIVCQYTDPRIHYFKNIKNCGAKNVVDNWNICLNHSTGEYIICMGDDDKLKPDCLQIYIDLMTKYPNLDIYHTRTEIIDENSNSVCILEERPDWESVYSLMYIHRSSFIGDWLFKTEVLRKNGGFYKFPYGWVSDYVTAFIAATNHGVANSNEVGFQYRGNRLSISYDLSCIDGKIEAFRTYTKWRLDFVSDKHPDNEEDKHLIELIKQNSVSIANQGIEDMIEFDIRKNIGKRGIFWLIHRKKYEISFSQYARCLMKSIKYRFIK